MPAWTNLSFIAAGRGYYGVLLAELDEIY